MPSRRSTSTRGLFHGFDFDSDDAPHRQHEHAAARRRDSPDIVYRDSLAEDHAGEEEKYTLVLANPPFAGSLDYENTAKDLQQVVKTKKTELLFLALFLRLLKPGGRAAVIVPDGVLFGSSERAQGTARILVEEQKLDAVISLPSAASSSPMPASRRRSCSSPRRTPAARITSGSTMCRPMAGRSTTSANRFC
jgi:type I restriction enzyme M protein